MTPTRESETPMGAEQTQDSAGATILDQTHGFIGRFVAMPSPAALDLLTVWIAHTHVRDENGLLAFQTTPRLYVGSTEPQSGKSMVLDMVRILSASGKTMLDATPAAFVTIVNEKQATVVLDEIDILFGAGGAKRTLVSLLNGGYRYGETWVRSGKELSVFAPVALGGLSAKFRTAESLAPLRQRCISIEMLPATPAEEYRMREHDPLADAYRVDLARWAKRNGGAIVTLVPQDIPQGITRRLREVAEPLFALADVAGGSWPNRIRQAARELMLGESDAPQDLPLADQLVNDVRAVFTQKEADKLSTVDLVDGLYGLPKSVWRDLWPSATSAPRNLASMLEPKDVRPVRLRFGDDTVRGYRRGDIPGLEHLFVADDATDERSINSSDLDRGAVADVAASAV